MRLPIALALACLSAAPALAAADGEKAKAPAAPEQVTQPAEAPAEVLAVPTPFGAVPYSYNADGRRDPFQNLVGTGGDAKVAPKPPAAGIAGINIEDLSVRGVMNSRERLVAMIQGPDNRTYLIHQGDKLADGVVKSITPQGLVLVQDVSDPRAKEKSREVRKLLRSSESDKE